MTIQYVFEVVDCHSGNSASINELEIIKDGSRLNLSTTNNDVYDSINNGIPVYWTNATLWNRNNITNNSSVYSDTNATLFLYNSSSPSATSRVGFSRFLINSDLSIENNSNLTLNVWVGGAGVNSNRVPKVINLYEVVGTYNKSSQINTTNNSDLKLVASIITPSDLSQSTKFTVNFNAVAYNKILLLQNEKTVALNRDGYDENENLIPVMTSNTAPSGIASASSAMSTSYSAWRAFDKVVTGNGWETTSSNGWLQYEFTQPIRIVKYSIYPRVNFTSSAPKDWTFEGSNDGTNWTVLDTQVNISNWVNGIAKNYNIINNIEYKNYRLNISSSNSYSGIKLGELEMYSNKINRITTLPSYSEQNLINYGMDSPVQVDGIFTTKKYILQDTISENTEGLWTTQINRKPLSIKFDK